MEKQLTVIPVDNRAADRIALIAAAIVAIGIAAAVVGRFWQPLPQPAAKLFFGPPQTFFDIRTLRPSPNGGAVVVWREGYRQYWVGRVGPLGLAWTRQIEGEPQYVVADQVLAVDENRAVLRYSRWGGRAVAVMALDEETGAVQWDVDLVTYTEGDHAHDHVTDDHAFYGTNLLLAGDVVLAWRRSELVTFDARTGRLVSADAIERPHSLRHRGGRVTLQDQDDNTYAWGPNGPRVERRRVDPDSAKSVTCVVAGSLVRVSGTYGVPLRAENLDDPSVPDLSLNTNGREFRPSSCGEYQGNLVLFATSGLAAPRLHVSIFDANGDVVRAIDVDATTITGTPVGEHPDSTALSGTLTRFVPFIAQGRDDVVRIVMLDLERGTIAWKSRGDSDLIRPDFFRAGSGWYVQLAPATIARFDGATGTLTAAVTFHDWLNELTHVNMHDGLLWIWGRTGSATGLPFAVLDARTLDIVRNDIADVELVTAALRESLGAP